MGVHGLWQLLEPAGRPVDIHSLRGKVLAVDASIWLHQLVKGFRDKDGNPLPNAHLLGVFYRLCKLLNYGIKPVFVFDGGVPILKRQTMAVRKQRKLEALDKSEASRQKLLSNYIKQQIMRQTKTALPPTIQMENEMASFYPQKSPKTSPSRRKWASEEFDSLDKELESFREKFASHPDVDRVQTNPNTSVTDSESSDDDYNGRYGMDYSENFSAIVSKDFDVLPLETQHEILFEMQESRKMNSWGKMEQMPQDSQDFSSFQMDRLVKRRFLQKKIQTVQQEMGQRHIHVQNLDELLKMDYNFEDDVIGSQEKGFVLLKKSPHKKATGKGPNIDSDTPPSAVSTTFENVPEILSPEAENGIRDLGFENESTSGRRVKIDASKMKNTKSIPELEEEEQIALAIQLSLESLTKKSESENADSPTYLPSKQTFEKKTEIIPIENECLGKTTTSRRVLDVITPFSPQQPPSSSAKFFDAVGFPSQLCKLPTSSSYVPKIDPVTNGSSEEDDSDDFEAVEDVSEEVSEKTLVNSLLMKTDLSTIDSPTPTSRSKIATIDITKVVNEVPEDDIFADIFARKVDASSSTTGADKHFPSKVYERSLVGDIDMDQDAVEIEAPEISDCKTDSNGSQHLQKPFLEAFNQESEPTACSSKSVQNQPSNKSITDVPGQSSKPIKMITAEYMHAQEKLNVEQGKLHSSKGFQERVASSISDQMSAETQELLALFGIPYVVSPMEAESQCAFLDSACLTDGTITDDSDIWLFGGLRVYKNFYSTGNRKIEFYQQADITKILNLDREKLILIAMLSGGDYSEGIEGVGPVTAMEILSEFPTNSTDAFDILRGFREWWDISNGPDGKSLEQTKVKHKLTKLKLRPGFPNEAVYQAYTTPSIDSCTEIFRFGNPDLDAIRHYTEVKFGWNQTKCDGMLLPVLKNLRCQDQQNRQLTLDGFLVPTRYELGRPFKRKKGSKRLHSAFKKLKKSLPFAELNLSSESSSEDDEKRSSAKVDTAKKPVIQQSEPHNSSQQSKDVTFPNIPQKKGTEIPQRIQNETQKSINKQKAIKIFQSKNAKSSK